MKTKYLMVKFVFKIHFDGNDQNNAILAPLMDCHDTGKIVSGELSIHSDSFNIAEQFPFSIRSAVKQK